MEHNLQFILQQDGGAKVFEYFGVNPFTQKKQKNPLRDNSQNFSLKKQNGIYIFADWVTDEKGDAFRFVQLICGVGYWEAYKIIKEIYGDASPAISFEKSSTNLPKTETTTLFPTPQQTAVFAQQTSNFHTFCQKIGIASSHLRKWCVGTDSQGKTVFGFKNTQHAFVNLKFVQYDQHGKRSSDIYSLPQKKNNKGETIGKYKLCLFGEHLLDNTRQKTVCLVESEKTAVIASWFYPQYDWLATGSANGLTDDKIHVLFNRQIIYLSDADKAGRQNTSLKRLQDYALLFRVVDLFPQRNDGFDIADYILVNLSSYAKGEKSNQKLALHTGQFEVENYLAELMDKNWFLEMIDAPTLKLNLQAGTGTGKTTLAKMIAKRWHVFNQKKTIIAVPLNAIAQTKYEESKHDHYTWGDDLHYIPYFVSSMLKGKNLAESMIDIEYAPVMFCNYDALPKLCEIIGEEHYNLIIDEQHALNKDFGFRGQKVQQVYKLAHACPKTILLSADTIKYGFEQFQYMAIQRPTPTRQVKTLKAKNASQLLPVLLKTLAKTNEKALVLLNSKKQIQYAKEILEKQNKKVVVIQSDTNLNTQAEYQYIMQHKKLPKEVDVVLCTSVIATGIDIYAEENINLIYCENRIGFDKVLCNQFFARIRNQEKASFTTLSIERPYPRREINAEALYNAKFQTLLHTAKQISLSLNTEDAGIESHALETPFAETIQVFFWDFNTLEKPALKVNALAVAYWVQTQLIANGEAQDLAKEDGFELLEETDENILQHIKLTKEQATAIRQKTENEIYQLYKNERIALAQSLACLTMNTELRTWLKVQFFTTEKILPQHYLPKEQQRQVAEIVFARAMKMHNLGILEMDWEKIIFQLDKKNQPKIVQEIDSKEAVFILTTNANFSQKLHTLQLNFSMELPAEEVKSLDEKQVTVFKNLRDYLKNIFTQVKEFTSQQLQNFVNIFYALTMTSYKATQLVKSLFELKETVRKNEHGTKTRYYSWVADRNFEGTCNALDISPEPIKQQHQTEMQQQKNEAKKRLQFRHEEMLKILLHLNCSPMDWQQFKAWLQEKYQDFNPLKLDVLEMHWIQFLDSIASQKTS